MTPGPCAERAKTRAGVTRGRTSHRSQSNEYHSAAIRQHEDLFMHARLSDATTLKVLRVSFVVPMAE